MTQNGPPKGPFSFRLLADQRVAAADRRGDRLQHNVGLGDDMDARVDSVGRRDTIGFERAPDAVVVDDGSAYLTFERNALGEGILSCWPEARRLL